MVPAACSTRQVAATQAAAVAHAAHLRSEARRLQAHAAGLGALPARELCKVRWLYYRGDDNYGLGNVLYDVAAAAALALALNRTLVYGYDGADRKFGALLHWPGIPSLADAEVLRQNATCGVGMHFACCMLCVSCRALRIACCMLHCFIRARM